MTSHPIPPFLSCPARLTESDLARRGIHLLHQGFIAAAILILSLVASAQITVNPLNKTVPAAAGASSFVVFTTPNTGVPWNVVSEGSTDTPNPSWITITSSTTFIGSGTVAFTYTENTTNFPRTNRFRCTRTDTDEQVIFEFIQEPPEQNAILNPTTIAIDGFGGTRDVAVQVAPAGTPWTAVTQASWIQILSAPTSGDGTLKLRILSNTTGSQRVADVFVLNSKVRVTQDFVEATFTLNPTAASVPAAGKVGSVAVTASTGNPAWTAVSNAAWITVTNGPNYTGNATVNYSVAANASNDARQGTITIAGATFTVTQAGADDEPPPPAATLQVSPTSLSFTFRQGGSATLSRSLNVTSSGDPLDFSLQINAGSGGNWLSANASSGTTPKTIQLSAAVGALGVGTYSATVVVTPAGGTAINVPATFTISPPGDLPLLPAVPTSLFFSRIFGGELPGAQRIRLTGPGEGISATISIQANAWLNAAISSDPTGTYVTASIRNVNLLPGIYDSAITVSSADFQFAPLEVPVRYVVNLAGGTGPRISSGGITNGATFAAGASPNTWISIFGSGLATSTQNWSPTTVNGALLPTSVGGTEVHIAGIRAAISFVSAGQVNALVPAIPDRGWVTVEVRSNGQPSELGYLWISDRSPAFFVYAPQGGKYPAAQHGDAKPVGPVGLLTGSRPAKALEAIAIFGTGFGATVPPVDPSRFFSGAAPLANAQNVSAKVGSLNAAVEFVGQVGPGLNQINIKLPALAPGEYPVVVLIDGFPTQLGLLVVVAP